MSYISFPYNADFYYGSPTRPEGATLAPNIDDTVHATGFRLWAAGIGLMNEQPMYLWPVNTSEVSEDYGVIAVVGSQKPVEEILEQKTYIATVSSNDFQTSYPVPRKDWNGPYGPWGSGDLALNSTARNPVALDETKVEEIKIKDLLHQGLQLVIAPADIVLRDGKADHEAVKDGIKAGTVNWVNYSHPEFANTKIPVCVCNELDAKVSILGVKIKPERRNQFFNSGILPKYIR